MARRIPRYLRVAEVSEPERCGRVPVDASRYAPHNSYGCLPLFYEDVAYRCRDCGREEVWTAVDQKWWFETVQGAFNARAVRCLVCRRARREAHAGTPRRSHRDRREGPTGQ